MDSHSRRAGVKAFAKINLTLEVLNKRPDGYHNLRTVFQTISLFDRLDIEYSAAKKTIVELESTVDIPDNLVIKAAHAVLDRAKAHGRVRMRLVKRIPMGGGLGGGSTDAAAVLLALPVLVGRRLPIEELIEIGGTLGSDVPFFLLGGTALGLGRGTELYPISEPVPERLLLVSPGIHVSTADAYRELGRALTETDPSFKMSSSQSLALAIEEGLVAEGWSRYCTNDFERAVFRQHPDLNAIKKKLILAGAKPALMTGSGAALFGIFSQREALEESLPSFQPATTFVVSLINRTRYRASWWRSLGEHINEKVWPPLSRYAR